MVAKEKHPIKSIATTFETTFTFLIRLILLLLLSISWLFGKRETKQNKKGERGRNGSVFFNLFIFVSWICYLSLSSITVSYQPRGKDNYITRKQWQWNNKLTAMPFIWIITTVIFPIATSPSTNTLSIWTSELVGCTLSYIIIKII